MAVFQSFTFRYWGTIQGQQGVFLTETLTPAPGDMVRSTVRRGGEGNIVTHFQYLDGKSAREHALISSCALSVMCAIKGATKMELLDAQGARVAGSDNQINFNSSEIYLRHAWGLGAA